MNLSEEIRGSWCYRYCVQVITKLHLKPIIFVAGKLVRGYLGVNSECVERALSKGFPHSVGVVSGFKSRTCRKQIRLYFEFNVSITSILNDNIYYNFEVLVIFFIFYIKPNVRAWGTDLANIGIKFSEKM
jgi:hypothetical protein